MNAVNALSGTIPGSMLAVGRRIPERAAMRFKEERGYRPCAYQQLVEREPGGDEILGAVTGSCRSSY